jgi:hypothetical protein
MDTETNLNSMSASTSMIFLPNPKFGSLYTNIDIMLTDLNSPLISYDSVTSDLDRLAKIKNITMFNTDLKNNKLPQWIFITPNMSKDISITRKD